MINIVLQLSILLHPGKEEPINISPALSVVRVSHVNIVFHFT